MAFGDCNFDERLYLTQDANYNVTTIFDNVDNMVERYIYDPFGSVTVLDADWNVQSGGSAYNWNYLHQGGRFDVTSGLYHFRFRDYSPSLGRWTSLDPLRYEAGDVNLYRTLGNDPFNRLDPSGLASEPKQPTKNTYRTYFWVEVPGVKGLSQEALSDIEVNHTIPQVFEKRFAQIGINIHSPEYLCGMTQMWHQVYTNAFESWIQAKMKSMGLDPRNIQHRTEFYANVDVNEVLKVRETLLNQECFKTRIITVGMNREQIEQVLRRSGAVPDLKGRQAVARESVRAVEESHNALQKQFPKLQKYLTVFGVFAILSSGVALADNIKSHPPHALAAWNDFEWHYRNMLIQRSQGQPISNKQWWDMLNALNNYLDAIGVPAEQRNFMFKYYNEHIGLPVDNEYYPPP